MILLLQNCESYCLDYTITLSDVLKISGAIIAFLVAFSQYKKSQKWKRAEFVYQLFKNFKDDLNVKRAMRMLDWNRIDIPLFENEIMNKKSFWFEDDLFYNALQYHLEMDTESGFSDEETVIRFIMDDFFEKLGMFNSYINKGLISKEDIESYLIYWISIIGDTNNMNKSEKIRKQLWHYIIKYGYDDVVNICKIFGYKISY